MRSFHPDKTDKGTVTAIVKGNMVATSHLMTDESRLYGEAKTHFATRQTVKHSAGEYDRGVVHTNTVHGYFAIFKPGMKGIYQH